MLSGSAAGMMRLLGCLLFFATSALALGADESILLTPFSRQTSGAALPAEWAEVTAKNVPKHTRYTLVRDESSVVLRADAQASMSSLRHAVSVEPSQFPILRWRWKIERLIRKSDPRRKDGDDFPARVYVFFDYDPSRLPFTERMKLKLARSLYGSDLPLAVLCYVWDRQTPVDSIVPSPYTDRVRVIVAASGPDRVAQWVDVQRNVVQDFQAAFGETAPRIIGVALATDTDNTGESAVALYGDIRFERAAP